MGGKCFSQTRKDGKFVCILPFSYLSVISAITSKYPEKRSRCRVARALETKLLFSEKSNCQNSSPSSPELMCWPLPINDMYIYNPNLNTDRKIEIMQKHKSNEQEIWMRKGQQAVFITHATSTSLHHLLNSHPSRPRTLVWAWHYPISQRVLENWLRGSHTKHLTKWPRRQGNRTVLRSCNLTGTGDDCPIHTHVGWA